jgi:hypothetical protein
MLDLQTRTEVHIRIRRPGLAFGQVPRRFPYQRICIRSLVPVAAGLGPRTQPLEGGVQGLDRRSFGHDPDVRWVDAKVRATTASISEIVARLDDELELVFRQPVEQSAESRLQSAFVGLRAASASGGAGSDRGRCRGAWGSARAGHRSTGTSTVPAVSIVTCTPSAPQFAAQIRRRGRQQSKARRPSPPRAESPVSWTVATSLPTRHGGSPRDAKTRKGYRKVAPQIAATGPDEVAHGPRQLAFALTADERFGDA